MESHSPHLGEHMKIITNIGMHAGLTYIEGYTDSEFGSDDGMQEVTPSVLIRSEQNVPVPIVSLKEEMK